MWSRGKRGGGGGKRAWGERGREVVVTRKGEGCGGEGEAMAMAERGAGGQQHLEVSETGAAEEGEGRDERCGAGGSGGRERVWGERGREVVPRCVLTTWTA
jgi:hypothetical protein